MKEDRARLLGIGDDGKNPHLGTTTAAAEGIDLMIRPFRQRVPGLDTQRVAREGFTVPPIAIFSITNGCNLVCKGCYAQALRDDSEDALSPGKLRDVVGQAEELGISFFVIAPSAPGIARSAVSFLRPALRLLEGFEQSNCYPHQI